MQYIALTIVSCHSLFPLQNLRRSCHYHFLTKTTSHSTQTQPDKTPLACIASLKMTHRKANGGNLIEFFSCNVRRQRGNANSSVKCQFKFQKNATLEFCNHHSNKKKACSVPSSQYNVCAIITPLMNERGQIRSKQMCASARALKQSLSTVCSFTFLRRLCITVRKAWETIRPIPTASSRAEMTPTAGITHDLRVMSATQRSDLLRMNGRAASWVTVGGRKVYVPRSSHGRRLNARLVQRATLFCTLQWNHFDEIPVGGSLNFRAPQWRNHVESRVSTTSEAIKPAVVLVSPFVKSTSPDNPDRACFLVITWRFWEHMGCRRAYYSPHRSR